MKWFKNHLISRTSRCFHLIRFASRKFEFKREIKCFAHQRAAVGCLQLKSDIEERLKTAGSGEERGRDGGESKKKKDGKASRLM